MRNLLIDDHELEEVEIYMKTEAYSFFDDYNSGNERHISIKSFIWKT